MVPFTWHFWSDRILEIEDRLAVAGSWRQGCEGGVKRGQRGCGYKRATRGILTVGFVQSPTVVMNRQPAQVIHLHRIKYIHTHTRTTSEYQQWIVSISVSWLWHSTIVLQNVSFEENWAKYTRYLYYFCNCMWFNSYLNANFHFKEVIEAKEDLIHTVLWSCLFMAWCSVSVYEELVPETLQKVDGQGGGTCSDHTIISCSCPTFLPLPAEIGKCTGIKYLSTA